MTNNCSENCRRPALRLGRSPGVFRKFKVTRTDGSSARGGKHHRCEYFVLDVDHDAFARAALTAYAKACESVLPLLALDMRLRYGLSESPWRDIDTAPEGVHVLACNASGYVGRAIKLHGKWEHIGQPNGWMPLPAAKT